ncbi:MAG: YciI family protein [Candidatus Binataceae bacterium]
MKFLCVVYADGKKFDAMSDAERQTLDADSLAYDDELRRGGHFIVADALQPVRTAKTVRKRDGKVSVVDGPFAETKEQLGGFILINARNFDEAVQLASNVPMARVGSIEVRPIMELSRQ